MLGVLCGLMTKFRGVGGIVFWGVASVLMATSHSMNHVLVCKAVHVRRPSLILVHSSIMMSIWSQDSYDNGCRDSEGPALVIDDYIVRYCQMEKSF